MSDETPEVSDEPYRFSLTKPVRYATKNGEQEDALWIELRPPTPKHQRECSILYQSFMRAVSQQGSDEKEGEVQGDAEGPTGSGIIAVLAMSTAVELADVMDTARKLFSSGVAFIEGEVKLTSHVIDSMSMSDFERMLGEYLVNFTLASQLAQAKKKSS